MENGYGNWLMVIINILIFLVFIKSAFKPKNKTDWRTYKVFGAFIVALFAEMYGFPFTIYLLTSFFGNKFLNLDYSHDGGHLLNTLLGFKGDPHFNVLHILSNLFIIGGIVVIASAWNTLYKAQKQKIPAESGLYRYIRHPQYLGFILVILGFLLEWPTLITLIMAPFLIIRYIKLSQKEEKFMEKKYGKKYKLYQKATPAFFPSLKKIFESILSFFSK
ncbi:MAG: S-isoprenylcysteine methyltransferase [Candidatus Gottesmanbacteria bacterium GW2011_GWC2_39_8]|uniref:S-isoprenylcysteine methyltransferase n=1 Tax=Candidatus Gottesmanbacteria bacterium GW2011_GWC2_39_8 TaxID=1618450 RepID=A0A0G0T6R0_9BACT|nr:MAG: S-isoprenylcysteine methyltransferase [Candidatus Gottesmanbacteria bacterium GW2011_GWC2_39_8]